MDCFQRKMSKGRRDHDSTQGSCEQACDQGTETSNTQRVSTTVAGTQFGAAKSFTKCFTGLPTSGESSKGAHEHQSKQRTRTMSEVSWRSSGSFASTVSSRSSSSFSECFANEGPIQQSAASLESPIRQRCQVLDPSLVRDGNKIDTDPLTGSHPGSTSVEDMTPRSRADTDSEIIRRFHVLDADSAIDQKEDAPSQRAAAASDEPDEEDESTEIHYCTGIKWFVKNNKLVVSGFSGWSTADKAGIRHGDILRGVDGVDVLRMEPDEDGKHPAMELLVGPYGSECELSLMRVDQEQVKAMMQRAQDGQPSFSKAKLELRPVTFTVPRLIRSDIGSPL